MSTRLALQAAVLGVLLALALTPSSAAAGSYTIFSCHSPSGRLVGTAGWSPENTIGESVATTASNTCGSLPGSSLHARLTGGGFARWRTNDSAGWTFRPPAGTSVSGFRAAVCGRPVADRMGVSISWPTEEFYFPPGLQAQYGVGSGTLGCVGAAGWQSSGNYVERSGIAASQLYFSVICTLSLCESNPSLVGGFFDIYAFSATLTDPSPPTVSAVNGILADATTLDGPSAVTFNAADSGGGLYRTSAELRVDGTGDWRPVATAIVDANHGACAPAGETANPYEFDALTPCRASVQGASLTLDSRDLPAGDHIMRVVVEDAAGNRTDVVAPRAVHVTAPDDATSSSAPPVPTEALLLPANNGAGASRRALVRLAGATQRRVRYGSAATVKGRLVDDSGQPIAGATLEIGERPGTAAPEPAGRTIGHVVTTRTGTFAAKVPAGTSRSVIVIYRANGLDSGWTSSAQLNLVVTAKVTARAKRTHVRNRHSAIFTGRVAGPIPATGVLVTLQVADGSKWIPVATTRQTVHTDRAGRFRLSYRFLRTSVAATFRFRVLADRDSGFPYDSGYSRSVRVHVRP